MAEQNKPPQKRPQEPKSAMASLRDFFLKTWIGRLTGGATIGSVTVMGSWLAYVDGERKISPTYVINQELIDNDNSARNQKIRDGVANFSPGGVFDELSRPSAIVQEGSTKRYYNDKGEEVVRWSASAHREGLPPGMSMKSQDMILDNAADITISATEITINNTREGKISIPYEDGTINLRLAGAGTTIRFQYPMIGGSVIIDNPDLHRHTVSTQAISNKEREDYGRGGIRLPMVLYKDEGTPHVFSWGQKSTIDPTKEKEEKWQNEIKEGQGPKLER